MQREEDFCSQAAAASHSPARLLVVQKGETRQVSICWRRARLQPPPIQDAELQADEGSTGEHR